MPLNFPQRKSSILVSKAMLFDAQAGKNAIFEEILEFEATGKLMWPKWQGSNPNGKTLLPISKMEVVSPTGFEPVTH